jgi:predicted phage terminase large subunit-like protein
MLAARSGGKCPICLVCDTPPPRQIAELDPPGGRAPSGATKTNVQSKPLLIPALLNSYGNLGIDFRTAKVEFGKTDGVVPTGVAPFESRTADGDPDEPDPDVAAELEAIDRVIRRRAQDVLEQIARSEARRLAPRARERLSEFVRQAWNVLHPGKSLEWNWHLDVVCDHVRALAGYLLRARDQHERGKRWEMPAQNLLINVPPRSLKTEIVGVFFPAWLWLMDPTLHVRYVSGNERVRTATSRMNRDLVGSKWYRETFGITWHVRPDADAIGLFENTCRGRAYWSTYEQKITGEGTDVIIVDDPIDAAKASSEIERTSVNTTWDLAVENRVNDADRCARIGIMQRLHEDEWSAHVLAKGWRHVCLPTEFEPRSQVACAAAGVDTPPCPCADCMAGASFLGPYDARTADGEILHPARMSERRLEEERAKGSLYYAGQHQQRPAPLDGGMFKRSWWGTFDPDDLPPSFRRTVIFMDCSAKKTVTGSRTAIGVFGEEKGSGRLFLLEVIAKPMDIIDMKKALVGEERMKNARAPYAPGTIFHRWPRAKLVVEDKAAGSDLVVEMKAAGINVEAWDPKNSSKESRAFSIVGHVEAGNVLLPRGAVWKDSFLHELSLFPNGKWDDQVDMVSMAVSYLRDQHTLKRTHY